MKLAILCLCSLSVMAQDRNSPCSSALQTTVSTFNAVIRTLASSNQIAGNFTDDLSSYANKADKLTDSVNGLSGSVTDFEKFFDSRTSGRAIMGYMSWIAIGSIPVTVVIFSTLTLCRFVRDKFIGWKDPGNK